MKQTVFETRQRAEELLREALNVWRQSDRSDLLEGLENDPIMRLMITALAYQANESASDLEEIKLEILQDFANLLVPYEIGHAIPATAAVELALDDDISEIELDAGSEFVLEGTAHTFIPLLKTRVINAQVRSIVRLDGRRWKVSLAFRNAVSDLSGLCFSVKNNWFQDLKVTLNGQTLRLAKPWDYSELPLNDCFGLDTILYNHTQTYNASATCMDLFARQNVRMFFIKKTDKSKLPIETETVDLVFEFSGISDRFVFDKGNFFLNTAVLVNARKNTVTLSKASPVVRIVGSNSDEIQTGQQFLHAIRPAEEQLYADALIDVRRVAADRFDQSRLIGLLNALVVRYRSDFTAFRNLPEGYNDKTILNLQNVLLSLIDAVSKDKIKITPGVYLVLRPINVNNRDDFSVDVSYLTTSGSVVNSSLKDTSKFVSPSGIDTAKTRQIAAPVLGMNEIKERAADLSMSSYYMATQDRIVTPADIKFFCYNELLTHYGITRDMVKSICVSRRQKPEIRSCGYEILVEIMLTNNSFVIRSFIDKIKQVEILIQKMIEVRSANIYPISVMINVE
ncbi:MAG: hypothetical protein K5856_08550 [Bacteroidaceae bacterium]|nr:hypothetical protein [Bacteroidaceae bacterium]